MVPCDKDGAERVATAVEQQAAAIQDINGNVQTVTVVTIIALQAMEEVLRLHRVADARARRMGGSDV